ncbi:MAG: sugar kinase, partial [Trueperaceae bacterium]|nr:sugar kinase [Trueperaceae bacterium]
MAELLLGVDIGTYSAKGVLVTPAGEVLAQHVIEHELSVPRPGWAEHDAESVWWGGLSGTVRALLSGKYSGADVAGVAVSAIGPCLLPLDAQGRPLRPGILYGVDTRASAEMERLTEAIGEEALLAHSGMAFTSQAMGPKIVWLRKNEPDVWRRTERLTTASSYLVYRLTGEHVIDRHTASHYMPLIDIDTLSWSDRYEDLIAPLAMLPRLGWSDELAGHVSTRAAAETGLRAGTPVAVGAVDALSEALSVGVTEPGQLMIMYGSTTFFILLLDAPVRDERVWLTAGLFPGQYALAAGTATSGSLTRWFRDQLARDLEPERA